MSNKHKTGKPQIVSNDTKAAAVKGIEDFNEAYGRLSQLVVRLRSLKTTVRGDLEESDVDLNDPRFFHCVSAVMDVGPLIVRNMVDQANHTLDELEDALRM